MFFDPPATAIQPVEKLYRAKNHPPANSPVIPKENSENFPIGKIERLYLAAF
jgi:hypothetical protein